MSELKTEGENQPMAESDADRVSAWARAVLADPRTLILDTETTGLDSTAEVIELAVINPADEVLAHCRFKPRRPIPADATAIHGITDADVADLHSLMDSWPDLLAPLLRGARIVTYNAEFDSRLLRQSLLDPAPDALELLAGWECAMEQYAVWYGDWSEWHGSYRWQRLPGGDHSAVGDARACLAVLHRMAGAETT